MSTQATAVRTQQAEPEQHQSRGGAVAVIQPPRLPYHPTIEQRFGVDRAAWRALTDAVFPSAKTTDSIILALSYCKARKLDPFKRVVHIVPVWDSERGGYVETVWPGIAEHRTTAFRTKQYAGSEPAAFGDSMTKEFIGQTKRGQIKATVTFPAWCQLTVYRMIDGQRVPVPGPRVYWLETYSKLGRADVPNDRWQRAPFQMIEKCAEAAALRRAFPEELGDEATSDEAGSRALGSADAKVIEADDAPPRPRRADFAPSIAEREYQEAVERGDAEPEDAHDPETGEVHETAAETPVDKTAENSGSVAPAAAQPRDPFWSGDNYTLPPPAKNKGWVDFNVRVRDRLKEAETQGEVARLLADNERNMGNYRLANAEGEAALRAAFATRAQEIGEGE